VQARRRGRTNEEQAEDILSSFEGLGIHLRPVSWQQVLPLALTFDRSAYDAAYLALSEATGEPRGTLRFRGTVRRCASCRLLRTPSVFLLTGCLLCSILGLEGRVDSHVFSCPTPNHTDRRRLASRFGDAGPAQGRL
jgi:hypothetical protein